MNKSTLRKLALTERKLLTDKEVRERSLVLLERFKSLDFSNINTIHLFLPIEEKKEPDTFLLIDWLRMNHPAIEILVPRADFKTSVMSAHKYVHRDGLLKNSYNILEPIDSEEFTGKIDLVLVPLLAFDRLGYRVGYGKGFYDRFLEHHKALKVGLSFFEAKEHIEDVDEYDIRLDLCLTPEKKYTF
jgi:5-formyltetrahydrofolate cyclo-ligase